MKDYLTNWLKIRLDPILANIRRITQIHLPHGKNYSNRSMRKSFRPSCSPIRIIVSNHIPPPKLSWIFIQIFQPMTGRKGDVPTEMDADTNRSDRCRAHLAVPMPNAIKAPAKIVANRAIMQTNAGKSTAIAQTAAHTAIRGTNASSPNGKTAVLFAEDAANKDT